MQVFATKDKILPMIKLEEEVEIFIEMDREFICLHIGPRDFQWERASKKLVGSGTDLGAFSGKDVEFWTPEDRDKVPPLP